MLRPLTPAETLAWEAAHGLWPAFASRLIALEGGPLALMTPCGVFWTVTLGGAGEDPLSLVEGPMDADAMAARTGWPGWRGFAMQARLEAAERVAGAAS